MLGERALAIVHGLTSVVWFLLVTIFHDRAIWFYSGALGFKDATTAFLFTLPAVHAVSLALQTSAPAQARLKRVLRGVFQWLYLAVIVTAVLTLAGVAFYAASVALAITNPDGPPSTDARRLAADMWNNADSDGQAIAIVAFVLLAWTGVLHLATLIWAAVAFHRTRAAVAATTQVQSSTDMIRL